MSEQVIKEISRLEDGRIEAMLKNDFSALDKLLANDLVYTHSSAKVDSKASFIESLRSGNTHYKKIDRHDVEVRVHDTTAIVIGGAHISVTVGGKDKEIDLRYSEVWLKREGAWQFALWHATPIPR
jgi:hypothetical protein